MTFSPSTISLEIQNKRTIVTVIRWLFYDTIYLHLKGSCTFTLQPNTFNMTIGNPDGCQSCDCDPTGTATLDDGTLAVCDQNTGDCTCLTNRQGRRCETCRLGQYFKKYNILVIL